MLLGLICLTAAGCSSSTAQADTTGVEATASIAEPHCMKFISANCSDNESGLDVAACDVNITSESVGGEDVSKLDIDIGNAYPGYEAYADFTIKNVGNYDVQIKSVTITNPSPLALSVTITDLELITLIPDETVDGTVTVGIRDGAEQKGTYTFNITIIGEKI